MEIFSQSLFFFASVFTSRLYYLISYYILFISMNDFFVLYKEVTKMLFQRKCHWDKEKSLDIHNFVYTMVHQSLLCKGNIFVWTPCTYVWSQLSDFFKVLTTTFVYVVTLILHQGHRDELDILPKSCLNTKEKKNPIFGGKKCKK